MADSQPRGISLASGVALALAAGAAGWVAHGLVGLEPEALDGAVQAPLDATSRAQPPDRALPLRDSPSHVRVNDCTAELSDLQARLDAALLDAEGCHADEIPWPEDIGDEWRANGFGDAVADALQKLEVEGDIALHCDEFPCIAVLPESADRFAVKDLLTEQYGDADVWVKGHGMVGPWGKRALRFIAAIPEGPDSETLHERVYDRTEDITQAIEKELRQEVNQNKGDTPPPPPPPEGDANSISEYDHVEK